MEGLQADGVQRWKMLTETGPGTPGGALMRRYWQPVMLVRDFPPGSPPTPVRLLSEDLVFFRDDAGRFGLLGLKCAHRCTDLSYGRVEAGGLRCVYHGWLYDVDGKCLEQPTEPERGRHNRIRQLAYPCIERGGAVWTYMGPGEPPVFPAYPALSVPEEYRYSIRWHSSCNYLQGNEGNIDPVHTSYLHRFELEHAKRGLETLHKNASSIFQTDAAPKLDVAETRFGLRIFAERRLPDPAKMLLRVTNFVMPNACAVGGAETSLGRGGSLMTFHVPIDDTHHWRYDFSFHSKKRLPKEDMDKSRDAERLAGDHPVRNAGNRYLQNRADMHWSYIGMGTDFTAHDIFATESQGGIHDHGKEHLVTSDKAIVRARRQLLDAMRDVAAGKDPVGVVRDPAENVFDDLLVLTEVVDSDADPAALCERFARMKIYELDPAVKTAEPAV
jgi:phenylpropionate dioxygenase-like ring-hydroxylating dioxygenase large terminal subunit